MCFFPHVICNLFCTSYGKKIASGYQDSDHSPRHRTYFRTPSKANIPVNIPHRACCLVGIRRRRVRTLPLPSILLANVQSLDNKLDEVRSRISYQRNIKNCNILCFTESWLNDDMDIQLAGYTQCMKSKEVSRFCSPEVEYIMINCRPLYLPREFSAILFVAVYLPPQTDAGTKTTLSQLFKEISGTPCGRRL